MNENIDLTKILKNCPKGTKLYSTVHGEVMFNYIEINSEYAIRVKVFSKQGLYYNILLTKYGMLSNEYPNGECILFPSKEQRDWSKFTAPWYKKEKFDPKTLQPFDKAIVRLDKQNIWSCDLFSFVEEDFNLTKCCGGYYKYCIPYNDDTKHLVGTNKEAPEYYRYWED